MLEFSSEFIFCHIRLSQIHDKDNRKCVLWVPHTLWHHLPQRWIHSIEEKIWEYHRTHHFQKKYAKSKKDCQTIDRRPILGSNALKLFENTSLRE